MNIKKLTQFHQKAYVCIHVFSHAKPVLLVSRPDADWCFLCGEEHPDDAAYYKIVGIGHILESDPSLVELMNLGPEEEAERVALNAPWIRTKLSNASH